MANSGRLFHQHNALSERAIAQAHLDQIDSAAAYSTAFHRAIPDRPVDSRLAVSAQQALYKLSTQVVDRDIDICPALQAKADIGGGIEGIGIDAANAIKEDDRRILVAIGDGIIHGYRTVEIV